MVMLVRSLSMLAFQRMGCMFIEKSANNRMKTNSKAKVKHVRNSICRSERRFTDMYIGCDSRSTSQVAHRVSSFGNPWKSMQWEVLLHVCEK